MFVPSPVLQNIIDRDFHELFQLLNIISGIFRELIVGFDLCQFFFPSWQVFIHRAACLEVFRKFRRIVQFFPFILITCADP